MASQAKPIFLKGDPILVQNARLQSRGKKLWPEILCFVAVLLVGNLIQGMALAAPQMIAMFSSDAFHQMEQYLQQSMEAGTFQMDTYLRLATEAASTSMPQWFTVLTLFSTFLPAAVVILYCRKLEKRSFSTMGLTRRTALPEYLIGLGVGLLLFVIVLGLNFLTGGIRFGGVVFRASALPLLLLTFLGYLIQGASEEILCRGYFCVSVSRWMPLWVGVLVNSIAFSLMHLLNSGITPLALLNLFLFGVFMSLYMIRCGNLWGACAIHSMWNFAQGNLFGLQVSGIPSKNSVFAIIQTADHALWNGGSFGPEGGLCVTAVLAVGILLLLLCRNRDRGQKALPVPEKLVYPAK